MGTVVIVVVVVLLLAAAAVAVVLVQRQRRRRELREQFGPEYERRVAETGDRKKAEAELKARHDRHQDLELRPLEPAERERFQGDWRQVQRGFVDDPGASVQHADALVVTIMRVRGYPVEDGDQRAEDLSVAHPYVVEHYREARRISAAHRDGRATTEDLRGAVTSYRSLVEALISDDGYGEDSGPDEHERPGVGQHEDATQHLPPAGAEATERLTPDGSGGSPRRQAAGDDEHGDGRRR